MSIVNFWDGRDGKKPKRKEVQTLRDEINRLKGEPGKPQIKANCPPPSGEDEPPPSSDEDEASVPDDYSSETEASSPEPLDNKKKVSVL